MIACSERLHGISMAEIHYKDGFDAAEFLALAQRVWPREYSALEASAALKLTINVGAWDDARLVGSVRILTDGYFFATIPEILVDPAYQRRGIGRRLMELALERAPRGKLGFGAQPQSVEFFDRIGCKRALTGFVAARPLPVGRSSDACHRTPPRPPCPPR
jgi:ribosomal protein S18 acetylase RimI-like enzyme